MYDDYLIEGNLRDRSLCEIWDDPNSFSYNRQFSINKLTGRCKSCEFGSYCAGNVDHTTTSRIESFKNHQIAQKHDINDINTSDYKATK